jgi:hypothetical protein
MLLNRLEVLLARLQIEKEHVCTSVMINFYFKKLPTILAGVGHLGSYYSPKISTIGTKLG